MANSLTQWPMQPIPFPQGVRTNPIGWGFGASTHTTPSAPSTPHRPPLHHSFTTPQSSSFGQAAAPSNEAAARHQWGAQTPTERKKRSRGSDTSSSSSINRAAKIASRPIAGSSKRRLGNERELVKDEDGSVDLGILLSKLILPTANSQLTSRNITNDRPPAYPTPLAEAGSITPIFGTLTNPETKSRRMSFCSRRKQVQMPHSARSNGQCPCKCREALDEGASGDRGTYENCKLSGPCHSGSQLTTRQTPTSRSSTPPSTTPLKTPTSYTNFTTPSPAISYFYFLTSLLPHKLLLDLSKPYSTWPKSC